MSWDDSEPIRVGGASRQPRLRPGLSVRVTVLEKDESPLHQVRDHGAADLAERRARKRRDRVGRLLRRNWPQRLRLEETARKGCQDDRRETDHGGIDQQARTADYAGLEQPVADEKQCMGDGSADE